MADKVYVGLSGGVDSAVSAYLLKQEGFDVTGVYMKNWSGDDFGIQGDCPWKEDMEVASQVAENLGINFLSYNFEKEYRDRVVQYFFDEYKHGRTPNPDIMCNKEIKFNLFLDKALSEGADYIATGHYVRKVHQGNLELLLKGVDSNKDQSYFLSAINYSQLTKSLFPVGHLQKQEVRSIADKIGLPNSKRPDSQGICFIGEIDVRQFIQSNLGIKEGEIVDIDNGKTVGIHKGVYLYTIGQREGIGVGGTQNPYYVVDLDIKTNTLYVGQGSNHPKLFSTKVVLESFNYLSPDYRFDTNSLSASIRYRQIPSGVKVDFSKLEFLFFTPQRAVSPGQSLVLYENDICIGGGIIKEHS